MNLNDFKPGDLVNVTFNSYELDFGHNYVWLSPAAGFNLERDSRLIQLKVNRVQHAIFMGVDVNLEWYYFNINGINVVVHNNRVSFNAYG